MGTIMLSKVYSKFAAVLLISLGSFICPNEASGLVWKMPPDVFTPDGGADLDFASDPFGNAFTTWVVDGGDDDLFVTRFSNITQSYGPFIPLSTDAISTSVATDASQTALVVWQDDGVSAILTSFFNGTTWVTPSPNPLDSTGGGLNPDVAMDGNGNGLAGWGRLIGITPPGDVVVSFFNGISQTWGALQVLNPVGTGGINPIVDISANGTAVAVWSDATPNLVASNFNGVSWTALPPIIGTNILDFTFSNTAYSVQIDAAGNALAMWQDSITGFISSSYFTGGVWGAPQNVSVVAVPLQGATFDFSPIGTGITVWTDAAGFGFYSEFIGGVWTAPLPFAANVDLFNSTVALDSFGNALFTWKDSVTEEVFSMLKPLGGPFGAPDLVAASSISMNPDFAGLSDNGRGFVTGSSTLEETTAFIGTYTLFPLEITGEQCRVKFATQTDRVNIISFIPSANPETAAYLLTRNGVLIAVIPASGPFVFEDHNRCSGSDEYTVTPISALGVPLLPPAIIELP